MESPEKIKAIAKPFYRAASQSFEHAKQHVDGNTDSDAVQVILSLDNGVEMLLKAILMNRGDDIMPRKGFSLSLPDALARCPDLKNAPSIKILRERRDNHQHLAAPSQIQEAKELYEATMEFVAEALETEFDVELSDVLRPTPPPKTPTSVALIISSSEELQRDISIADDLLVWAEGESQNLAVYMKEKDKNPIKLTPIDEFEYMPVTNGNFIAARRQQEGVVLYDVSTRKRRVLSETGLPNSMLGEWLSVQGVNPDDGPAGISLYNLVRDEWDHVSKGMGDTSRLTSEHVFWNEFSEEKFQVKYRKITGGEIRTLAVGANHVSPTDELVAWTEYPDEKIITHVTNYAGKDVYKVENATFPNLLDNKLTYLRRLPDNSYGMVVADISTGQELLDEDWVGFPMGRGPQLFQNDVYFETKAHQQRNTIMSMNIFHKSPHKK